MTTTNTIQARPPVLPPTREQHERFIRVSLGWIIALLAIVAAAAIIVSYNVIELDLFIHHLQQAFNQLGGGGGSNCYSQGGTDFSC